MREPTMDIEEVDEQEWMEDSLEAWLDDEPKCQVRHQISSCTVRVRARMIFSCGHDSVMLCESAVESIVRNLASGLPFECSHCKKPAHECRKVVPV